MAPTPVNRSSEPPDRFSDGLFRITALVAAVLAAVYLGVLVHATRWGMDADEAVHAVEALRLFDRLAEGDLGGFLHGTWFPERWQEPVNPHVRWYPPVHALCTVPFFALLGPSDFSARLPSVVFLFLTCGVFYALGRRLAPRTPGRSGLLAVVLLLISPNVLTFSAQSLTEPASLFFSFLALLAYLRSLETDHSRGRAALAGAALAVAMLTKYDHGGLLALCLGLYELGRQRLRLLSMVRGGTGVLFGLPLAVIVLWFAHPDKLASLGDSVSHPFAGSERLVFLDFFATWVTEIGSGVALGLLALVALPFALRRADPGVRATALWALITMVFLGLRSRFHFRYHYVEAPIFLLLAAVVLPDLMDRAGRWFERVKFGVPVALALTGLVLGGLCWATAQDPQRAFEALRGPFAYLYDLRQDHFGLSLPPDAYVDHFASEYPGLIVHLSWSGVWIALGLVFAGGVSCLGRRASTTAPVGEVSAFLLVLFSLLGPALGLYLDLGSRVDWELESHPQIQDLQDRVLEHAPVPSTVLLGGGWDQLTNNGLRWHRVTRPAAEGPRPDYDDVPVVGDMIGSLVFPPEPRIRHWAHVLGTAPAEELPERVALVDPDPEEFLYQTRMGPEVAIYREILARRGGYRRLALETFEPLNCTLEVLGREGDPGPPLEDVQAVLSAHGIEPDTPGNGSRYLVGEGGWSLRDESLRHFLAPPDLLSGR